MRTARCWDRHEIYVFYKNRELREKHYKQVKEASAKLENFIVVKIYVSLFHNPEDLYMKWGH
jgi:hypothetical protein